MKALVKAFTKPGLWMEDVPKPIIKHDEVLIKIKKTAICGTDLHIYKWDKWAQHTIPVPMVIGHEYVGEIVEVGNYVKNLKIGDRVSGEGHITCRHCRQCRCEHQHLCPHTKGTGVNITGCFAEYFALPARNVVPIPDDIPDDIASFLDPLGNAVHTALSYEMAGEDVLITGAGPIGIMAVAICKYVGAHNIVISDVNEYRLEMAKKMGATHAINVSKQTLPQAIKKINIPDGFGVGLEMSGNTQAIQDMISLVTNGGKIALLGISPDDQVTVNWNDIVFKGLFLKGIYGREMFSTWYKMIALLQSGLPIAPVVTHHFSADDFQKGFDVMLSGQCGKVVLSWE